MPEMKNMQAMIHMLAEQAKLSARYNQMRAARDKNAIAARLNELNARIQLAYAAKASEAMKKYGGNPIVRGGKAETIEGHGVARNVVIEFASFEAARTYAHSPEYAAAKKLREGAGTLDLVVVEGAG